MKILSVGFVAAHFLACVRYNQDARHGCRKEDRLCVPVAVRPGVRQHRPRQAPELGEYSPAETVIRATLRRLHDLVSHGAQQTPAALTAAKLVETEFRPIVDG